MSSPASRSAASSRSAPEWATPSRTARTTSGRPVPRVSPKRAPRAPKSHCGVPKPSRAGTATTPPVSSQAAATASDSAARGDEPEVLDQPVDGGAGRQHDALDAPGQPAAALPGDDREAAALAAGGEPGPGLAQAHVEHGAGAEGGLGQARAGCSPARSARPADRRSGRTAAGRPAGRWRRRARPTSRRWSGRASAGMPRRSRASWPPAVGPSRPTEPGDARRCWDR